MSYAGDKEVKDLRDCMAGGDYCPTCCGWEHLEWMLDTRAFVLDEIRKYKRDWLKYIVYQRRIREGTMPSTIPICDCQKDKARRELIRGWQAVVSCNWLFNLIRNPKGE